MVKLWKQVRVNYYRGLGFVWEKVTGGNRPHNYLAITVIKNQGLKVPEDITVIGFTNSNIPGLFNLTLWTIRLPAFEMGYVATELLVQIIENKGRLPNLKPGYCKQNLLSGIHRCC